MTSPHHPRSPLRTALGVALALALTACGSDSGDPTGPGSAPVASVSVSPDTATLVPEQSANLTATLRDAEGNPLTGRTVTWTATPTGIAMVSGTGVVTGIGKGTATITATSEDQTGTATVNVVDGGFLGSSGGEVVAADGAVRIQLPAGALSTGTALSVEPVTSLPHDPRRVGGTTYTIGPPGTTFAQPGTLTIRYLASSVGFDSEPQWFRLHRWSGSEWELLPGGSVDTTTRLVTGTIAETGLFAVIQATPNPVPTVSEISPVGAREASGALTLTVQGAGFLPSSEVRWNGAPRQTTFLSESHLEASIGASDLLGTGLVEVTVWSPGPGGGSSAPVPFAVLPEAASQAPGISAGFSHTCGLTPDGSAYCWGSGESGRLGTGSTSSVFVPTSVSGSHTFASISSGGSHTCALTPGGSAWCWGFNGSGALGDGTAVVTRSTPVQVAGGITFESVVTGWVHTCGLTSAGEAWCWGRNNEGQLGDGSDSNATQPRAVAGGHSFSVISPSFTNDFTCAIDALGAAWCWGRNGSEQLGDGTTTPSPVPVRVQGDRTYSTVSVGNLHSCALAGDGRAWCWGRNFNGRLGDGTIDNSAEPVPVSGSHTFASISVGHDHTCALEPDGRAWCWGAGGSGGLGDGQGTNSSVPVAVSGDHRFATISTGSGTTCGVTLAGEGYCWGHGGFGKLGSGTTTNRLVPHPVSGGLLFR